MALTFRCMELLSHTEERVFQTPLVFKELPLYPLSKCIWIIFLCNCYCSKFRYGQEKPICNIFMVLLVTQHFRHVCSHLIIVLNFWIPNSLKLAPNFLVWQELKVSLFISLSEIQLWRTIWGFWCGCSRKCFLHIGEWDSDQELLRACGLVRGRSCWLSVECSVWCCS